MPIDLEKIKELEPASGKARSKIDADELLAMCQEKAYSVKDIEEHFNVAHGTANSYLFRRFLAKELGRVEESSGEYYYTAWENLPPAHQAQLEEWIEAYKEKKAEGSNGSSDESEELDEELDEY